MARTLLAIAALALIAASCGPGPLPAIPVRGEEDRRFPSKSDEPLDLDNAIRSGKVDEVRRLLENGANPNARWGGGDHHPLQEVTDPSSYAAPPAPERVEILRLLLAHGADPDLRWCPFESRGGDSGLTPCTSARARTPLISAAAYDMTEIVETLLAAGADPTLKDWSGASALDHASGEIAFELIARRLFPRLSTRNRDALTSLEQYAGGDATPLSRAITGRNAVWFSPPPIPPGLRDTNHPDWTFYRRTTGRVRLLLNIGANPNERMTPDWVDWTPLALALMQDRSWTMRVLLRAGADPNGRWCYSLDRYAAKEPRTKDPACHHRNGTTPLMQAALRGRVDLIRPLLEHGANPARTDWNGKSAADLAATDEIRTLLSQSPTTR